MKTTDPFSRLRSRQEDVAMKFWLANTAIHREAIQLQRDKLVTNDQLEHIEANLEAAWRVLKFVEGVEQ